MDHDDSPSSAGSTPASSAFAWWRQQVSFAAILLVAVGGVLGASGRYAIARLIPNDPDEFPLATFITNVAGSFALGLIVIVAIDRRSRARILRPLLAVGLMGSFTTFSTLAVDNVVLVDHGAYGTAAAYLTATLVVGISAGWFGMFLGRRLVPSPTR